MASFDFAFGETDNALYWAKLRSMSKAEVVQEYKELMQSRGEGGDSRYNLEMCFDILRTYADALFIELPQLPQDRRIYGYIMEVETPESSSISGYGYDYFTETLYIRYRKNGKVYEFNNITNSTFNDFIASSSKGGFVSKLKKEAKK